jgi:hypothetical protein
MTTAFQLAELNIAQPLGPLDGPVMAEFMANLERINRLGDESPGFVWRLQDETGNATALEQPFGPGIISNLTVWTDHEALRLYTYKSEHAQFIRRRTQWFQDLDGPHLVLWWIPAGHHPNLVEGKARLDHLAAHGPAPHAFTFAKAFDPAGQPLRRTIAERVA